MPEASGWPLGKASSRESRKTGRDCNDIDEWEGSTGGVAKCPSCARTLPSSSLEGDPAAGVKKSDLSVSAAAMSSLENDMSFC